MPRLRLLFVFVLCALACSGPARAAARTSEQLGLGERVARYARSFVGVRYSWGGTSPRTGFDCSGLVAFVYRRFGVKLPHYTVAQYARGRRIPRSSLRAGDLVFFAGLRHVGIYVGGGSFVHAPHTGARVRVERLSVSWYRSTFAGARRIRLGRGNGAGLAAKSRPAPPRGKRSGWPFSPWP